MTDLFPTNLSDGQGRSAAGLPALTCRYCGSTPAVAAVFERHTGMVFLRKTETIPGPFCRDCGLSWFRATTAHTLAVGWLGLISVFTMPFVVVQNLLARRKVARLGPPLPPPGIRPLDPGRPLLLRLQTALVLLPVALLILAIVDINADAPENQVGKCVSVSAGQIATGDSAEADIVDCAESHDAVVTAVVDNEDQCPADSIGTLVRETGRGVDLNKGKILCLGESVRRPA